jgi:hypothetical protein
MLWQKLYVFLMRSLERDIGSDGNGSSVSNNSSMGAGGGAVVWERLEALKLYRRLLLEVGSDEAVIRLQG